MVIMLLALHAFLGLAVLVLARRLGRFGLVVGGIAPALTAGWAVAQAPAVARGEAIEATVTWVPELGLGIDVRFDGFALLMTLLVSGIGTLVFAYAWHYFGSSEKVARAAGLLTLFAGSMLGVVTADNLLLLYLCWELTSITSYLLIGIDDAEPGARASALHALLVTSLGGLAMLGGFVILGQRAGTYRLAEVLGDLPADTTTVAALLLVLLGAFTKSAQYPFHSWLPAAMVAPTPISAYLHSAAMVKAGVYLIARLAPAAAAIGPWRPLVVSVGLVTMVAGGVRALRPHDLKQLLAFGTISQLGFLTVLLGIGKPEATAAGCALLLAHGMFKAALFMVVGIVDHETGTRDVRQLPQLAAGWSAARGVAVVSAASMAAVPPLAGFVAKEEAYASFIDGSLGERVVLAVIVCGSALTVAYSLRFAAAVWRPALITGTTSNNVAAHAPSRGFVAPAVVLAVASVALGVVPAVWAGVVDHAAHAIDTRAGTHLALWHGFTPALGLSLVTLAAGVGLFRLRRPLAKLQSRLAPTVTGADVYEDVVRRVLHLAARTTSILQSGSLPIYCAIIFTTAALAPTIGLATGPSWSGFPQIVSRPAHVPIVALLVSAALAATLTTRRFAAALLLGVVGYGMALLFVVQGAPDLALTQFAVETLSVVVFLLVLRRLPDRFERRAPAVRSYYRIAVSAAVGVFVVAMALASAGARTEPPISREMSERALAEGDGKNVVNVILVDIRGMDTMGEVTVLVAAGLGIVALGRVRERHSSAPDDAPSTGAPV